MCLKLTTSAFTIALMLLMLFSCTAKDENTSPAIDMLAEAERLDSTFLAAFNRGDVDGVMQLYWNSPFLVAYGPMGETIHGFDAWREALVRDINTNKGAQLTYTKAENIVFNDVVIGHGTFDWSMPVAADSTMTMKGRYTEVKAIKDGKMVVILDHVSIAPPVE